MKNKRKYKYHTDEFLRKRQNDSDWREYYLRRKAQRKKERIRVIIFFSVLISGLFLIYQTKFKGTEYDFINKIKNKEEQAENINAINNNESYQIDQKAMTVQQVEDWVDKVLNYRKDIYEWSVLNEEPYEKIITTSKESEDGLVYIEVRRTSADGYPSGHITSFRINDDGYLEEYDDILEGFVLVATEYGDIGKY
ncbi:hypothetical protein [Miniphocaeibacter massiliensis]|uniref:hypothetical protein n=1 Tax=Miniphocaeibacter massiliensis TaxID=2041841 RepID=UPI000C07C27B|nr:hypothetical protein [Miniphocaeibacter massiliensis]